MASQGQRVLAIAEMSGDGVAERISVESVKSLTFLGFLAIFTPLTVGATETVGRLRALGLKVAMATGDMAITAEVIAHRTGILAPGSKALVKAGLDVENWEELCCSDEIVAARLTPEQKVCLVQALKRQGHVVCAVGDGVNDAPMLAAADFSVARGNGSPVTKSVAACVLLGDDLQSLASLLERARSA